MCVVGGCRCRNGNQLSKEFAPDQQVLVGEEGRARKGLALSYLAFPHGAGAAPRVLELRYTALG